jgi:hypothetical protein
MAVIIATAVLVPDYQMHLMFLGPIKMKYLALGAFILTSLVDFSANTGGKVSHIGGAIYGYAYMYYYKKGVDINSPFVNFFDKLKSIFQFASSVRKFKTYKGEGQKQKTSNPADRQKKIDAILDKISRSGYDALSKDEKDFLFKASKENK